MARQARAYTQGASPGPGRADELMEQEPSGDDQPNATMIPDGPRPGGAPAPLTAEELEQRSRLGQAVRRSALPAGRDELVQGAREMGADDQAVAQLATLPTGRVYHTVYEIWEALGNRNEDPRG